MPLIKTKDNKDIAFKITDGQLEVYEVHLDKQAALTTELVTEILEYVRKHPDALDDTKEPTK